MYIKNLNDINLVQVLKIVDLIIPAKNAKLGPPVGPALSPTKIKVNDFCVLFNNVTSAYKEHFPIRVKVIVFKNKSFNFWIKTPSTFFLINNLLKKREKKVLKLWEIYKIALIKSKDINHLDLKMIFKNILCTAKQYNIKIIK